MGLFFTKHEVLGQVEIAFDSGRWSVSTTLSAPWYGVAFLHYLERTLNNCHRENAMLFLGGMAHNLGGAVTASSDGSSLTEAQVRSLFDGFRERSPATPIIRASAELARRRGERSPIGHKYFALTHWAPLRLPQPDLLNTLVPFYDRLVTLPVGVSMFVVKALTIQLVHYLHNGPPTLRTLGHAPNAAMFEALKDTYGADPQAVAGFAQFTAGA